MNAIEIELGVNKGKIAAIAAYEKRTGVPTAKAVADCENYFRTHNLAFLGYDVFGEPLVEDAAGEMSVA